MVQHCIALIFLNDFIHPSKEVSYMSKKNANYKQQVQRQEQESAALKNIFNTFLLGLAAECYLFIVYRGYIAGSIDSLLAWDNILRILMWLGAAALVGGGGLALVKRSNAKLRTGGIYAALAGAFFAVSGWVMTTFFDIGVITMCTVVPVATVLMLIYFLYQRECFVNTLLLAGTLFTIWICGRGLTGQWSTLVTIGAVVVVAALAAFALLLGKIRKNGGKVKGLQLFPADCDYRIVYLVTAVCAVLALLALLLPGMSYYLIWAAVVALFGELTFYTTKLM